MANNSIVCPSLTPDLIDIFNTTLYPISLDTTLPYIILLATAFSLVLIIGIISVFNFITLITRMSHYDHELKYAIFWNVSLFFAISIVYLLMILFLRAAIICQLMAEMMLAFAVYQFLNLIMIMHGGKAAMLTHINGTVVSIFPLCWCRWCIRRTVNKRRLIVYNILIAQMVVVVPGVDFLGIIIFTENQSWYDFHSPFSPDTAYLYLNILRILSFVIGNSSLMRMVQANWSYFGGTHFLAKFLLLHTVLNTVFILRVFLGFFVTVKVINCHPPFTAVDISNQIHSFMTISLMLISSIIARLVYISYPGVRMEETHRIAIETKDIIERSVIGFIRKESLLETDPFVTPYTSN